MKDLARIVFEAAGTMSSPTAKRQSFLDFVTTYQSACEKKHRLTQFQNDMSTVFAQYPEVEFRVIYYNDFQNISRLPPSHPAYALINNCIVDMDNLSRGEIVNLNRDNIEEKLNSLLSEEEHSALNAVENYEKNLLEADLVDLIDLVRARPSNAKKL